MLNAGRRYLGVQDLAGKVFVTSGLGGMSGAQAKAAVIVGCVGVIAEVSWRERLPAPPPEPPTPACPLFSRPHPPSLPAWVPRAANAPAFQVPVTCQGQCLPTLCRETAPLRPGFPCPGALEYSL